MSNQTQCPNCGGYKVSSSQKDIFERRSYSIYNKDGWKGWHLIPIFVAIVIILMLIGGESFRTFMWIFCIFPLLFGFMIAFFKLLWAILFRKGEWREKVKSGVQYSFSCQLCGYEWQWSPGQPKPQIHVRLDLITKGEQRLEAERKKQQDDAAALYYLTHKK